MTVVFQITGKIDGRHPAGAERPLDRITIGEGGLEAIELVI